MGDLMKSLKDKGLDVENIPFKPKYLAELVSLIDDGTISGTIAKKVFQKMFESGKEPGVIVEEEGLRVVNDEGVILTAVTKVLENNPQSIADYKAGKDRAVGFLMGQVMKETGGKANPQTINKLILEKLKES